MNSSLREIRRQLAGSKYELLSRQNVVATGIGYKRVSGEITSDLAIICSVTEKKPKNRISAKDLVPSFIRDIPTDVEPVGQIRAFRSPKGRFRPVMCGISAGHFLYGTGTLGCLVKKNGISYFLSNNHVIANNNEAAISDPILQPGPDDGGQSPRDQFAELSEFIPLHFWERFEGEKRVSYFRNRISHIFKVLKFQQADKSVPERIPIVSVVENKVDCALAMPLHPECISREILDIGSIRSVQSGELGLEVKKSGRSTGLTTGIIQQVDVTALVNYSSNQSALFTDQLIADPMSRDGDSGSAVLDYDNHLVGLLFAGSEETTLINRIENVFEALKIELA